MWREGMRPRGTPLTEEMILAWADAHHERTGRWPHAASGPIPQASGETWTAVNQALGCGHRGLPGGDTLAKLLDRHRRGRPQREARQPWTAREDELVRGLPPAEAARRTGRSLRAVYQRRFVLGIRDGQQPG
jgi:hypothetical protein